MAISLGGLGSGIDTNGLVDSLVGVARQPIAALDKQKTRIDSASTTLSGISSRLATLKNAALALSTSVGFSSFSAASNDTAVVASASGSANPASYSVSVTQLAKAQKSRSAALGASNVAAGQAGTLSIKVGTADAKPVSVLATDTLADIASKITASGARVTASVFNDGSGSRLLVHGIDTGAENAFTITEQGTTFGFNDSGNQYETAQDALLTVDGMAVTSKSNQVTGVIAGVKLALVKPTTAPATVQVTSDTAALKQKVTTFINAYNDFVNTSHNATGFAGTKASNPMLAADSTVRGALHRVGALLGAAVPGSSGTYTTLASVGIKASREGTFSLDATKFDAAMTADPDGVRKLFVTEASLGATGVMKSVMTAIDGLVTGSKAPLQARIDRMGAQSKRLADQKVKMEQRLTTYEEQLKRQFNSMDTAVSKYNAMGAALNSIPTNKP